jgi:para-nitrobenzyl esterase
VVAAVVAGVAATALAGPAGAGPAAATAGTGPLVWTDTGPLRGAAADGYLNFQGIPYAAPPVGPLRWRDPQPVPRWSAPRDATAPASPCPQGPGEIPSENEDCLYLNVAVPQPVTSGRPRPVLVWIHGGGFAIGAGADYDAHRMAIRGDVIVVTINYRLGIFGFFGFPGLAGSGTFGLADQQAALRWVQRNAAAFGGDPGNVTVGGNSAGAYSVCAHLAAPSSAGLFSKALVESGPCTGRESRPFAPFDRPLASVRAAGSQAADELGCTDARTALACLRRLAVPTLLARTQDFTAPAVGTRLLPTDPGAALRAGRFQHVPILIGNNHDEDLSLAAGIVKAGTEITAANWPETLRGFFTPAVAARVQARYPVTDDAAAGPALGTVLGDWNWACPTQASERLLAARVPTYGYEFADPAPPNIVLPDPPFPVGASHATEVSYLFDPAGWQVPLTPAQQGLADAMMRYWTNFARTGNPNGTGLPAWSRYRGRVQSLAPGADGITPADAGRTHRCAFWSTVD